jgi:hypothetical protein
LLRRQSAHVLAMRRNTGSTGVQRTLTTVVATPVAPTVVLEVTVDVGMRRQLHTDEIAELAKTLKQAGFATVGAARLAAGGPPTQLEKMGKSDV